ncbi:MAG: trimeric intracellular cation channel family protein [Chlorobi bacterium]|nr:trimeric intracellular cation channel family protein [Chlorobiota bacterium]
MNFIEIFDYIGTMVFAISGTLTAANKRLDFFGATVIGFVTAVGGGTLRDMMLGYTPVAWMRTINYFLVILAGVMITILFSKQVMKLRRTMFLFDTIGIAIFTIIGLNKALEFGIHPALAVIMGITSAVVGGIIRDTLTNEVPLIFKKEIYATACIAGALIYLMLHYLNISEVFVQSLTILSIITIRILAVRYNISLPRLSIKKD